MRLATLAILSFALAQDGVPLRLEFKAGDHEDMRFDLDMKVDLELASDAIHLKQAMAGKVLFTLGTTCKKVLKGGYVVDAVFRDLEMDQQVAVGEQKVTVKVKGKDVKMEGPDGEVIVDTEKDIHPEMAAPILKELGGFGESMEIELDARGLLKDPKKGKPLPKILQGVASSGNLYPFVLPEKPVGAGDEWVHENEISTLGEMKLTGKPIKVPIKYRLERFEGEGAARVAVLSTRVDAEFKEIECAGKMEGVAGEVSLKIKKLSYKGTGETRFLAAAGRVEKSVLDLALKADMSADSEALGGAMEMKVGLAFKTRMAPKAARKRDF